MLLPQYSLRRLFGITTACSVVFAIFAFAMRGSALAAAVSVAIVSLVIVAVVHLVMFGLASVIPVRSASSPRPRDPDADAISTAPPTTEQHHE
jgi:hypothetical protein